MSRTDGPAATGTGRALRHRVAAHIPLIVALAVFLLSAMFWATTFELEACADAGGSFDINTGACRGASAGYIPQLARTGLFVFWSLFLGLAVLPAWLTHRLLGRLTQRNLGFESK